MSHYQTRGEIPSKRHIVFRKPNGDLYAEEVVSTEGFSNIYSIIYHLYEPTRVLKIDETYSVAPEVAVADNMQNRSFRGFDVQPADDYLESRKVVLFNSDVYIFEFPISCCPFLVVSFLLSFLLFLPLFFLPA